MPKITFNVPEANKDGTLRLVPKQGTVIWLSIGPRRVKMVLQEPEGHLTHWASGMIALTGTRIKDEQLRSFMQNMVQIPARRAAERIMAMIINDKGAELVLEKMDKAEVLNK